MPYCSKQDLIDRFGESELISLTDRLNTGQIDDEVLNQAIVDASAEIDIYLSGRYTLPLIEVPTAVKTFACNMARYHLYDEQATEQVNKRYDNSVAALKAISKGDVALGLSELGNSATPADLPEIESEGSVFSRSSSKGFI